MNDDIASPCNKICVVDEALGWCRGCRRTLAEISRWGSYSRAEKLAVLEKTTQRKRLQPVTLPDAGH